MDTIIEYFGDRLVKPSLSEEVLKIQPKISPINQKILLEVGLPDCHSISGVFTPIDSLRIIDNNYLAIQSTSLETTFICIELSTNSLVSYDLRDNTASFINSNLEIYLTYIKIDEDYVRDIRRPLKFGPYNYDTYEKYANYLQSQFEKINNDYSRDIWSNVLEQMSYGIF